MRTMYFYHEIEDQYEDMLNECYGMIDICGMKYDAGRALKNIDETAFRCGCSDWSGEIYQEVTYSEMTEEEQQHYIATENQVMYCHVDEVDCDE
jgi:hypothetical protein